LNPHLKNNSDSIPPAFAMESGLVSWQYENFSSAKLSTPPVSPVPPSSPTLYSYGIPAPLTGKEHAKELVPSTNISSSRAQMASSLLKNVELFGSSTDVNGKNQPLINTH